MTTIAYRDGIMAADSQVTGGDVVRGTAKKIFRINDLLVACCGGSDEAEEFRQWLRAGAAQGDRPRFRDDSRFSAMTVDADGAVNIWNKFCVPQLADAPFHALGSGNELALGAMAFGASAEQAVNVACSLDIYSGGPIQVEYLHANANAGRSAEIIEVPAKFKAKAKAAVAAMARGPVGDLS
ncbi:MAG TPA: hypothetical protein VEH84_16215 [Alphaproteobacteria bacterium]|nr:hypothetical protein [Alphaproteobacteria bacterium]